jgi:hypothetical protein
MRFVSFVVEDLLQRKEHVQSFRRWGKSPICVLSRSILESDLALHEVGLGMALEEALADLFAQGTLSRGAQRLAPEISGLLSLLPKASKSASGSRRIHQDECLFRIREGTRSLLAGKVRLPRVE